MIDILRRRAVESGGDPAFKFLPDNSGPPIDLSYRDLDGKAMRIAAMLQSLGMQEKRCLLVFPTGPEFVCAFFGCLYAGVIAVPTHIPDHKRFLNRFASITSNAGAEVVLSTSRLSQKIKSTLLEHPSTAGLVWVNVEDALPEMEGAWRKPDVTSGSLAYLQYTSGSTSDARGVMISHGNMIANSQYITKAVRLSKDSVSVCWLPHFHDMGLVDGIILPVHTGYLGILMSPQSFLHQPYLWLKAISDYGATHCGGPNFGFEHCLETITAEMRSGLRLDSWKSAYSGSETVRKNTLDRFATAFSSCGFRKSSFYPCYGLAEGTLLVTGGELGGEERLFPGPAGGPPHVGCGHAWPDTDVMIVNPDTRTENPQGKEGEIWVKGGGIALGYWNCPEETNLFFGAYPEGHSKGPFLRTGDLGILVSGELFVTGRLKDLIIIRGSNYHPQDIEYTLESCDDALAHGRSAVFSVDTGMAEELVVMAEVKRSHRKTVDAQKIVQRIRDNVSQAHGLDVAAVVVLNPGNLPVTSSGKVRRTASRKLYLSREISPILSWTRSISAEPVMAVPASDESDSVPGSSALVSIFRELLGSRPFTKENRLLELGMDSLLIGQLKSRIKSRLNVDLPIETFFENPTVADLASLIGNQRPEGAG